MLPADVEEQARVDSVSMSKADIVRDAPGSSLFVLPTGFAMPARTAYLGVSYILPTMTVAAFDRISLTVIPPFFISAKFTPIQGDGGAFSIGGSMFAAMYLFFWGVGTVRISEVFTTLGMMRVYHTMEDYSYEWLFFGAETKICPSLRAMIEISYATESTEEFPLSNPTYLLIGLRYHYRQSIFEIASGEQPWRRFWISYALILSLPQ